MLRFIEIHECGEGRPSTLNVDEIMWVLPPRRDDQFVAGCWLVLRGHEKHIPITASYSDVSKLLRGLADVR